jgi:hypothetical protein
MMAVPLPMPVKDTAARELVAPSGIRKLVGHTLAIEELLLLSAIVVPPVGAGLPKVTGKLMLSNGATVRPAGKMIAATSRSHFSSERSTGASLDISSSNVLLLVT